jgi:hypothetical protein
VTGPWASVSGPKYYPFASGSFSVGQGQYFGAYAYTSASAGSNNIILTSYMINSLGSTNLNDIGRNIGSLSAAWPLQGLVTMTQTDTGLPVSFATADVTTASNNVSFVNKQPWVQMVSLP